MNMQAMHTRLAGKAFALSRCTDSRDKKSRNRRTKEERKTMIESFIKTYGGLNSGKFPSLNLTHKEVGGSFYTVREIVREIIQENRVLGPGKTNSKILNLEDCLEEHSEESVSMDSAAHLSIATFSQSSHQIQEPVCSSSTEHRVTSEEIIETDKSGVQKNLTSHLNDLSNSKVMHGEPHKDDFSNGVYVKSNLVNVGYREANFGELSGKPDDKSAGVEEMYAEVQVKGEEDHKIYETQRHVLHHSVAITSSFREETINGGETGNRGIMGNKTNSLASGSSASKLSEIDILPETNNTMNSITGSVSDELKHFPCNEEDSSFPATATMILDPESSQEVEGSRIYLEVSKTSAEVGANMPFESNSYENGAGPLEVHPLSAVDEFSAETLSKSVSQDLPALATTKSVVKVQPMIQHKDLESVASNTNAFSETLHHSAKEASHAEVAEASHAEVAEASHAELQAGNAYVFSNTVLGGNSSSILSEKTNEEPAGPETNPFWAVIQSVVSAFVKFWTE